jgi:hypothetical protein
MTYQEIQKFGEIQYLKGRLDELHKALPTITNLERRRKIDQRIEKYFLKLKKVDEIAYYLYQIEHINRHKAKEKSKLEIKNLLEEILNGESKIDPELRDRILTKLNTY